MQRRSSAVVGGKVALLSCSQRQRKKEPTETEGTPVLGQVCRPYLGTRRQEEKAQEMLLLLGYDKPHEALAGGARGHTHL